jgi:2Fe-2S ferredoxin
VPTIRFLPSDVRVEALPDENLRDAAIRAGVHIPSTCGGVASCGLCKVKVVEGADRLNALTPDEVGKLGNVFFITKERLACQAIASGEVACEVPDEQAEREKRAQKAKDFFREKQAERARTRTGR